MSHLPSDVQTQGRSRKQGAGRRAGRSGTGHMPNCAVSGKGIAHAVRLITDAGSIDPALPWNPHMHERMVREDSGLRVKRVESGCLIARILHSRQRVGIGHLNARSSPIWMISNRNQ